MNTRDFTRYQAAVRFIRGESATSLSKEYNCSVNTIYVWTRAYRDSISTSKPNSTTTSRSRTAEEVRLAKILTTLVANGISIEQAVNISLELL